MLTKEQIPILEGVGVDISALLYAEILGGTLTPMQAIEIAGMDIAGPAIAKAQRVSKKGVQRPKLVQPAEMQAARIMLVAAMRSIRMAWAEESGEQISDLLAKDAKRAKALFAEAKVPDLDTLFTSVKHPKGSARAGQIKGSVSQRVGKWGGKAVTLSIRFDALQKSRASKEEEPVVLPSRSVKRAPAEAAVDPAVEVAATSTAGSEE